MTTPKVHVPRLDRTIFAHRGLNKIAPENTMAAFHAAADAGVEWIETDVDILQDGSTVIIHDTHLDRTTNHSGSIYDVKRVDLGEVDAGAWFSEKHRGQRLPSLRNVVEFMNDREVNANIELKSHETGAEGALGLIDEVVEELESLSPERQVIVSSFSPLILAKFHEVAPQYCVAQLYEGGMLGPDWRTVLELTGASYVHPEVNGLSRDQVRAFRDAGYGVNVWTVNDPQKANELFNWGATGVFTDVADQLI